MSEWVSCGGCGLKHRRREDRLCPRCGANPHAAAAPLEAEGGTADVAYGTEPAMQVTAPPEADITLGQKIGAVLMIVNALMVLAESILFADVLPEGPLPKTTNYTVPLVDVGVSVAILRGYQKAVPFAMVRLVLGTLVFTAVSYSTAGGFGMFLQLCLSGGILLLLAGEAKRPRITAGAALVGTYMLLVLAGMVSLKSGSYPLGMIASLVRGDVESEPAEELRDDDAGWRMNWPGEDWRPRKASAIAVENPLVTQWAVHPRYDAHLLVIAESLPPGAVGATTGDLQRVVEANMRKAAKSLEVLNVELLDGGRLLLHVRANVNGMPLEYYVGLLVSGDKAVQVHGFAQENSFPHVSDELRGSIESLTLL